MPLIVISWFLLLILLHTCVCSMLNSSCIVLVAALRLLVCLSRCASDSALTNRSSAPAFGAPVDANGNELSLSSAPGISGLVSAPVGAGRLMAQIDDFLSNGRGILQMLASVRAGGPKPGAASEAVHLVATLLNRLPLSLLRQEFAVEACNLLRFDGQDAWSVVDDHARAELAGICQAATKISLQDQNVATAPTASSQALGWRVDLLDRCCSRDVMSKLSLYNDQLLRRFSDLWQNAPDELLQHKMHLQLLVVDNLLGVAENVIAYSGAAGSRSLSRSASFQVVIAAVQHVEGALSKALQENAKNRSFGPGASASSRSGKATPLSIEVREAWMSNLRFLRDKAKTILTRAV